MNKYQWPNGSNSEFSSVDSRSFHRWEEYINTFQLWMHVLLKHNVQKYGVPNCVFFFLFGVLKLLVGWWWWCGAESLIQSRLKSHLLCSWYYSRIGNAGWVQDFIFLCLMLIKGTRRQGKFKIFLWDPRDGNTLLRSSASC